MFLMVGVLVLGSYGFALQGAAIFLGLVVAFNLIAIAPVFFADKKMPYRERFQRLEHTEDRLDLPVLMDDWFGRGWMITFLALVGMLALAYTVGHGEASRKERYLTLKEAPDTVVLRTYGDVFISARFDRATKEMSNDIVLMWLSEKKQTEFRNELIGPLVLAKPPVPKTIAPAAKTKSTASAPQLAS